MYLYDLAISVIDTSHSKTFITQINHMDVVFFKPFPQSCGFIKPFLQCFMLWKFAVAKKVKISIGYALLIR